jgi:hypothetical protein
MSDTLARTSGEVRNCGCMVPGLIILLSVMRGLAPARDIAFLRVWSANWCTDMVEAEEARINARKEAAKAKQHEKEEQEHESKADKKGEEKKTDEKSSKKEAKAKQ